MIRAVSDDPVPAASWWGVGAAATQCEGAAPRADWAGWEAEGWAPPSSDGNGFRTRYADDFAHWAEHGVRHYRLTVEWARLEPFPGHWDATRPPTCAPWWPPGPTPASTCGPACCTARHPGGSPTTSGAGGPGARPCWPGPATSTGWPRRSATWWPGGCRSTSPTCWPGSGYLDGTFPPGRHDEDDGRTAAAGLAAAEAEAARLLRSGGRPVAVTPRLAPGQRRDDDDLLVVAAPVTEVERELERVTGGAPDASLLVVLGDPARVTRRDRARRLRTAIDRGGRQRGHGSTAASCCRRSTATSGTAASTPSWASSTGTATPARPSPPRLADGRQAGEPG